MNLIQQWREFCLRNAVYIDLRHEVRRWFAPFTGIARGLRMEYRQIAKIDRRNRIRALEIARQYNQSKH